MARFGLPTVVVAAASQLFCAAEDSFSCSFPRNTSGIECWGLTNVAAATNPENCSAACCAVEGCQTWQWCTPGQACATPSTCWIGAYSSCKPVAGWIGGAIMPSLVLNMTVPPLSPVSLPLPGNATSPSGDTISANSNSMAINGKPWMAISGEIQFARVPAQYWKRDMLRMKAGGLDMVGTYVFWIHHEETEGVWEWSGDKDLRAFVLIAQEVGLKVFMRLGPWAHGECRNGGFPEWLANVPGIQLRSTQPLYMSYVIKLYAQIAAQLEGLYWYQDGGVIVGAQVDNEYGGSAEYLIGLRNNATSLGIIPAYFTKTGWPSEPFPFASLLPEFGGYTDGFWDRSLLPNLPSYQAVYMFAEPGDDANNALYPKLLVELGGGMTTSYHRRVRIMPEDIAPAAAVFVGSGAASLGYYIYHGGMHPVGNFTTFQEQQGVGEGGANDMPVRDYDFHAPVGALGQVHGHYHTLRRLHLAVATWGQWLGAMQAYFPEGAVTDPTDTTDLRWGGRSDGAGGWLVLNTFQRNTSMSDVSNVSLTLLLAGGHTLTLPPNASATGSVTVLAGTTCIIPFNMPADWPGTSFTLAYSYATPVANLPHGAGAGTTILVLAAVAGLPAELAFADPTGELSVSVCAGVCTMEGTLLTVRGMPSSTSTDPDVAPVLVLSNSTSGTSLHVLLVDWAMSSRIYKGTLAGASRLFFVQDDNTTLLWEDSNTSSILHVSYESSGGEGQGSAVTFGVLPAPTGMSSGGTPLDCPATSGLVIWCTAGVVPPPAVTVTATLAHDPGRAVPVVIGKSGVAQGPNEDGRDNLWGPSAIYSLAFEGGPLNDPSLDVRLRLDWAGDVSRVYPGPFLGPTHTYPMADILADCFYNTDWCEFPLTRLVDAAGALTNGLVLKLLPLGQGAPIYLPSWPSFPDGLNSTATLHSLSTVQVKDFTVTFVA